MRQEARHPISEARIVFDEPLHEYRMLVDSTFPAQWEDGERFPSVTTFIGHYCPDFDSDAIALKVSRRTGQTAEQVKAEWAESGFMGTRVHANQENMMNGRQPDQVPHSEREYKIMQAGLQAFQTILSAGWVPAFAELMVFSPTYRLAGTVDAIFRRGREWLIVDWKTNKSITAKGYLGERMLAPIQNLEACHLSKYGLQLNIYQRLLIHEGYIHTAAEPRKMLVHLTPTGFKPYVIQHMPETEVLMLDYLSNNWALQDTPF